MKIKKDNNKRIHNENYSHFYEYEIGD